jgi:hypothetical protein
MKQKTLNDSNKFLTLKKRIVIIFLMGITCLSALFGLIWSIKPVAFQSSTIQVPDTYEAGSGLEKVQFPLKRDLTVSFPSYIRYGDVQTMHIYITPQKDPLKCDDICIEKHLTYDNVWLFYQVKTLFSFEVNNLLTEPKGETILPLTKSTAQEFSWKIKAVQALPVYVKSTVYFIFDSVDEKENFDQLVFAKELKIPVKKAGPFSFPLFRIICVVLIMVSLFSTMLNLRNLKVDNH